MYHSLKLFLCAQSSFILVQILYTAHLMVYVNLEGIFFCLPITIITIFHRKILACNRSIFAIPGNSNTITCSCMLLSWCHSIVCEGCALLPNNSSVLMWQVRNLRRFCVCYMVVDFHVLISDVLAPGISITVLVCFSS